MTLHGLTHDYYITRLSDKNILLFTLINRKTDKNITCKACRQERFSKNIGLLSWIGRHFYWTTNYNLLIALPSQPVRRHARPDQFIFVYSILRRTMFDVQDKHGNFAAIYDVINLIENLKRTLLLSIRKWSLYAEPTWGFSLYYDNVVIKEDPIW